jgi:glycosyltransferase involved in cell wall biosynthesis
MRVALLHAFAAEAGGAETHVTWLQQRLVARGHVTTVVDLEARAARSAARFRQTVLEQIAAFAPEIVHLHNLNHAARRLVNVLANHGWPIVRTLHDHSVVCPAGSLFARGQPCERCLSGGIQHAGFNGCINVLEAVALSVSAGFGRWRPSAAISRFLTPSQALATTLRHAGVGTRIDVVGAFVPDDRFAADTPSPSRTVVFAGRHVAGKGLETLLSASRALQARVLVLGTGPLCESVSARVRSEGLSHVRVPGYVTGASYLDLLRRAAVVVVPSTAAEVCPTVACEAFAAGIPVIASAVGGLPELIGRDERGLLVPPGDPVALRRSIDELLNNEARRRAMGLAARAYARDHLTADRYCLRLADIYAEVSALPRRRSRGFRFRRSLAAGTATHA